MKVMTMKTRNIVVKRHEGNKKAMEDEEVEEMEVGGEDEKSITSMMVTSDVKSSFCLDLRRACKWK